jgi:hypothetical protein
MNQKKLLTLGLGVLLAGSAAACNNDKLTDINKNPNNPEDVPASSLFTSAVRLGVSRWLGTTYDLRGTEFVAQHLAEVQYPDEDAYKRLGAADTRATFDGAYTGELADLRKVIVKGEAANEPGTTGPALVMRTWSFSYLTDTWGDVPYFEALAGDSVGATISPKYDPQAEIYADFYKVLGNASTLLASAQNTLGSADPIYGGSPSKWAKFSNSLRARLALRVVNVDPALADAQLKAAFAAPGGLIASNADNATFKWPGDGVYDNPWAVNFQTRDDHRVSRTLLNPMLANNDPRVGIYAMPTVADPSKYAGLQNGLTHAGASPFFNTTSRPGAVFYPGATAYGTFGGGGKAFPSFLMTYAEVNFIKAEAAARSLGGLTPAQAQGFFQAGIRASMEQWGVPSAAIDTYLASAAGTLQAGAAGLTQIAYERWVALYSDGGTAWALWRRTCVPSTLKPGPNALQNTVIRRFQYSPTEVSVNKEQLDAAIARQGADAFTTRMWWDTKPTAAPTFVAGCGQS